MQRPDGTPQDTDPWPSPTGVKVYAIGLGQANAIDSAALTQLASATGAPYLGAEDLTGKNYFLLEKYFTQIFMETAGLAQISDPFYTIAPGAKHKHEFDILPGDVNAMVVLRDEPGHRLPFHVESPKGEILSGNSLPAGFSIRFRSTPTARFAEFFFPHKEPDRYVGRWTVWVEHPGYVCAGNVGKDAQAGFLARATDRLQRQRRPDLLELASQVAHVDPRDIGLRVVCCSPRPRSAAARGRAPARRCARSRPGGRTRGWTAVRPGRPSG